MSKLVLLLLLLQSICHRTQRRHRSIHHPVRLKMGLVGVVHVRLPLSHLHTLRLHTCLGSSHSSGLS